MNAASGTAARETLTTGRNRTHNRIPAQAPGSRFPPAPSSGSRLAASRTPPAPPLAAGLPPGP